MLKIISVIALIFYLTNVASAFPENVRHGYTSCKTCHYSPMGGGALTEYGKRLSEEVQSTWSKENDANFLHNKVSLPKWFDMGGDVRYINYQRDTDYAKESRGFLMQADLEFVFPHFWKGLSFAVAGGSYDEQARLGRGYFMYDFNENWSARLGYIKPQFGINTPEHETATKKPLGFNQGSEKPTLEIGYTQKQFEVYLSAFSGQKGEGQESDTGLSLRPAYFFGEKSKLGLSIYSGDSEIDKRLIYGPFLEMGFTNSLYLLSEVDFQQRSIKEPSKALLEDQDGMFVYNKLGWEFYKGAHTFMTYEIAHADTSESDLKYEAYGLGMLWYPIAHVEAQLSYASTKSPGFGERVDGNIFVGMLHYYF